MVVRGGLFKHSLKHSLVLLSSVFLHSGVFVDSISSSGIDCVTKEAAKGKICKKPVEDLLL